MRNLLIHSVRSALKMVHRDKLARHIDGQRHVVPSDQELQDRGYKDSMWNRFKHSQVYTGV